jgi:hypothetical protein
MEEPPRHAQQPVPAVTKYVPFRLKSVGPSELFGVSKLATCSAGPVKFAFSFTMSKPVRTWYAEPSSSTKIEKSPMRPAPEARR